jgi:hypothetical protein
VPGQEHLGDLASKPNVVSRFASLSHQNDVHISIRLELFTDGALSLLLFVAVYDTCGSQYWGTWQLNWSKSIISYYLLQLAKRLQGYTVLLYYSLLF